MQEYTSKEALMEEIKKTAAQFIAEFEDVADEGFYASYNTQNLSELKQMYQEAVSSLIDWLQGFSDDELFQSGGRKWASSTTSNWPIWKWVHINTVAPFKTFRSKIRKWKKLYHSK